MCVKLFANNLQACILLFLGGATFGILTIFIMSLNGIVIGAIMEIVNKDHTALFRCRCHPPARHLRDPGLHHLRGPRDPPCPVTDRGVVRERGLPRYAPTRSARIFLLYVLPLVAIAACVEAFITPVVIHLVA